MCIRDRANDERARKCAQRRLGEDVTDQSVIFYHRDLFILKRGHPGRLLATVLEGEECVVTKVCDVSPCSNYASNTKGQKGAGHGSSLAHSPTRPFTVTTLRR